MQRRPWMNNFGTVPPFFYYINGEFASDTLIKRCNGRPDLIFMQKVCTSCMFYVVIM